VLLEIQRRAEDADGEVGEVGSFFVELNPADDAVVLHVLRHFGLVDAKVVGEFSFEVNFRVGAAACVVCFAAATAAREIAEADAKSLASLDVIRSDLVGIGKQKNAWARGSFVEFVEAMQTAPEKPAQHGFELSHARGEGGLAGAAVDGAFGRKLGRGLLGANNAARRGTFGLQRLLDLTSGVRLLFFGLGGNWIGD